ncbi:PREDICTED: endogenous retrovirus group S71 member 1 Env polyprotein [Rhinopithecus bieti]|uniref:endogenous retrovirus group S71 member 1 Env polyprotein n=1 Tax=Rhinopithecus bieti TaxID=61621 RepID=UPI00083C6994|nr:PREDICTED: endogenous retrovirus group S71 member 1 Env polyprotein [Rhinopithecus bieti]
MGSQAWARPLKTSFKSRHVLANTTWKTGTSKEVSFAVNLCALFPEPAHTHEEQCKLPVTGAGNVDLVAGFRHSVNQTGCGSAKGAEKGLQNVDFYLCPGNHPDSSCRYTYQFFCLDWTCVTLATYSGGLTQSSTLSIARASHPRLCTTKYCNPPTITVHNPNSAQWYYSMSQELRLYILGFDVGTMFTIQKKILVSWSPPKPIGPLTDLGDPMFQKHPDKVNLTVPLPFLVPKPQLQ